MGIVDVVALALLHDPALVARLGASHLRVANLELGRKSIFFMALPGHFNFISTGIEAVAVVGRIELILHIV